MRRMLPTVDIALKSTLRRSGHSQEKHFGPAYQESRRGGRFSLFLFGEEDVSQPRPSVMEGDHYALPDLRFLLREYFAWHGE